MTDSLITTASDIKRHIIGGWELWHLPSADALPGRWEMRKGAIIRPVGWDAINHLRSAKSMAWFERHTEEIQITPPTRGNRGTWCYRLKQRSLRL